MSRPSDGAELPDDGAGGSGVETVTSSAAGHGQTPGLLTRRPLVTLTVAFVVSRIGLHMTRVHFQGTPLVQLLDFRLLRHNLVSSVWHMHMQPPLYNLLIGGVLAFPTSGQRTLLALIWMGVGLALSCCTYLLLVECRVPRPVALGVTVVGVLASPSYVLAENWAYTALPSACLVVTTCLFAARYLRLGSTRYAFGFAASSAGLVLLNSTYQWVWLVPLFAVVVLARRRSWRTLAATSAVPLALVGLWYVKNEVMFGTSTTSSWLGMNLARLTLDGTSAATIERLVHAHTLTPLALVPSFSATSRYAPRYVAVGRPTGIPALDEPTRQEVAAPPLFTHRGALACCASNFNDQIYVAVSSAYLHDDIAFIEHQPGAYVRELGLSFENWFTPSDQYVAFDANWQHLHDYAKAYDVLVEWQPHIDMDVYGLTRYAHVLPSLATLSWQSIVSSALALFGLPVLIWRRRTDRAVSVALGVVWWTVLYSTFVTSLLELGENNRLRLELGPLPLVAAAVVVVELVRTMRGRFGRKVRGPSGATDVERDVATT